MVRVCNRVLTPLLVRHGASTQLSHALLDEVLQYWDENHVSFAPYFAPLWCACDPSNAQTGVFVLGQLSSILVRGVCKMSRLILFLAAL